MSSGKTHDDEVYEEGVHDGQGASGFDQFAHNLTKGYSLNRHDTEIYNKGYEYGVDHQSDSDSDPDDD